MNHGSHHCSSQAYTRYCILCSYMLRITVLYYALLLQKTNKRTNNKTVHCQINILYVLKLKYRHIISTTGPSRKQEQNVPEKCKDDGGLEDKFACLSTHMEVLAENFVFLESILKGGALQLKQVTAHVHLRTKRNQRHASRYFSPPEQKLRKKSCNKIK